MYVDICEDELVIFHSRSGMHQNCSRICGMVSRAGEGLRALNRGECSFCGTALKVCFSGEADVTLPETFPRFSCCQTRVFGFASMSSIIPDTEPSPASQVIVNISCYKFVALDQLPERKTAIRRRAVELNLKGTVLLSSEGINLFVAGPQQLIRDFVEFLREDSAFSDLQPKESVNEYQPFSRMLVKIKQEIIAFGIEGVAPMTRTSPKLSATELRQWLDEGRKVHLLDTRNDYEYDLGTFDNAIKLGLDHFREFPRAITGLPEELKDEPIVMFCTGVFGARKLARSWRWLASTTSINWMGAF